MNDQEKSSLDIADLQFPSASHGIAVGSISRGTHEEPVSVVTSDGGGHWQLLPLKEMPISLFFLNDHIGWMVTSKGLWQTLETGKSWTKLPKVHGEILRVYFADQKNGWAAGTNKTVLETHYGGHDP